MKMKGKNFVGLISGICLLFQMGCTSKLWNDTDPNARIWVMAKDLSEEELKQQGVSYLPFEIKGTKGYLIEKDRARKMMDYHLRMLGTPVTLTTDATSVVVVGFIFVCSSPEAIALILQNAVEAANN